MLFDTSSLTLRQLLKGHPEGTRSIAFSPDGQLLASAGGPGVILWDLRTRLSCPLLNRLGKPLELDGTSIVFAPDGNTLIFGGETLVSGGSSPDDKALKHWEKTIKRLGSQDESGDRFR